MDIRPLTPDYAVSPQIAPEHVGAIAAAACVAALVRRTNPRANAVRGRAGLTGVWCFSCGRGRRFVGWEARVRADALARAGAPAGRHRAPRSGTVRDVRRGNERPSDTPERQLQCIVE